MLLLAGRNGVGKSTLIRIAAGCLRADAGLVRVDGETIERPTLARMARRGVFFLPDQQLLTPGLKVGEQLIAVARRFRMLHQMDVVRRDLDLPELEDQTPTQLSVGQLRRATLALPLLRNPAVLLADEPLRGIDPTGAERLLAAMQRLARNGAAIVVSGHEVTTLMEFTDDVVWCTAGTTHAFASPGAAAVDWAFQREFLGGQHCLA
jgi:ABC-type multidrug transport system ATPase subunit